MKWLAGKKTYIGMIGLGVVGILQSLNIIDDQTANVLYSALAAWTGVAVRSAMKKMEK